jgi:hypothetical protein
LDERPSQHNLKDLFVLDQKKDVPFALSYDTNADRDGAWLRKRKLGGSGAPLILLVGASGSNAGRAFFPLRPTPRP